MIERRLQPGKLSTERALRFRGRLNDLDGTQWVRGTKSIMFQEGLGSKGAHSEIEKMHPAPFAYLDAERLIRFFSREDDKVLDPFAGVGSTLKACALSGRHGLGIELNGDFAKLARKRLVREVPVLERQRCPQKMMVGDCRKLLSSIPDDSIQFILTSPPYWNILSRSGSPKAFYKQSRSYGNDNRDFALIAGYDEFVRELAEFAHSMKRVLVPTRYLALIVSDFRNRERLHAFHADLVREIQDRNCAGQRRLVLQGITILAQNSKQLFPYGFPTTYVPNIHHQYVLIFRNIDPAMNPRRLKTADTVRANTSTKPTAGKKPPGAGKKKRT